MTAREYFALPEPTGGFLWELHFGELVRKDLRQSAPGTSNN